MFAVEGDAAEELPWQSLRQKRWCKPLRSPADRSLPSWRPADRFHSPQEIRPAADVAAVSGACALLEGEPSTALRKRLSWDEPPQVGMLARQIEELRDQASLCTDGAIAHQLCDCKRYQGMGLLMI